MGLLYSAEANDYTYCPSLGSVSFVDLLIWMVSIFHIKGFPKVLVMLALLYLNEALNEN